MGDRRSQFRLGMAYRDGKMIKPDPVEAAKWIRKSASQGSPSAQYTLGGLYLKGDGVILSKQSAIRWFSKAAEQGHTQAQYNLALCLKEEEEERETVLKWLKMAAASGYAPAQCDLGLAYLEGNWVPKCDDQALKWFSMAAEQGYTPAQYNLGVLYHYGGNTLKPDETEANSWLQQAASNGNEKAHRMLKKIDEGQEDQEAQETQAIHEIPVSSSQGDVIPKISIDQEIDLTEGSSGDLEVSQAPFFGYLYWTDISLEDSHRP